MFNKELSSEFEGQLLAFHAVWDIPSSAVSDFELAQEVFQESGFGELEMDVMSGDMEAGTMAICFSRKGTGEPAIYAAYLAAQATHARRKGVSNDQEIKERLFGIVERLKSEPELRELVLEHSLARTAEMLSGVQKSTWLQAGFFGINDLNVIRELGEENLRQEIGDFTNKG